MPGNAHDVTQDGRRRWQASRALAVEHQLAGRGGLDEDRVVRAVNAGKRVRDRHQGGVNANGDRAVGPLRDRKQLDDLAGLASGDNVGRRDGADAFAVDVVERHALVECEGGEDRGLRRGVEALDVRGGVRLGVAKFLRLLDSDVVVEAALASSRRVRSWWCR